MNDKIIALFTYKSREKVLNEGGSSSWRLNRAEARKCAYALCVRNARDARGDGHEPHKQAFMIGRVRDVVPTPNNPPDQVEGRWLVRFSEYANVEVPDVLGNWRNPVRYTSLSEIGIDPATLDWHPMPKAADMASNRAPEAALNGLSIAEAKPLIAKRYDTTPENVEIIIRG